MSIRKCPICSCPENIHIMELKLDLVNDINLNDLIKIKFCEKCNFYFSDSLNSQEDYNNYYLNFNNYKAQNYCLDKDNKCFEYLQTNISTNKSVLDYGSGNNVLYNLLKQAYEKVDCFDIGMPINNHSYDVIILSHVLEHIYDLYTFINTVSNNLNVDGLLYIEIPNAEYYNKISDICPLQEINLEHINFFSKYALNKFMIANNYVCLKLDDDFFYHKNDIKYYVIRGIFKKNQKNDNFITYLTNGINYIDDLVLDQIKNKNIYVYGCGQFLFKIIGKICTMATIINIIDDNTCYLNKTIKNVEIINYDMLQQKIKENDTILLATKIHDVTIKEKLLTLNIKLNIITI